MASLARRNSLERVPHSPVVMLSIFLCRRRVTKPPFTRILIHLAFHGAWALNAGREARQRLFRSTTDKLGRGIGLVSLEIRRQALDPAAVAGRGHNDHLGELLLGTL